LIPDPAPGYWVGLRETRWDTRRKEDERMRARKFFAAGMALIGISLLLLAPITARAQDEDQDPPSRVARLNYASGSVSFQPGGEGDWVQAVVNRPLTTGDNLWTDKDARAELHVGSTALRNEFGDQPDISRPG